MLKIPLPGCLDLSQATSAQFTIKMCVTVQNRKKSLKPPILGVQGRSKLLILMSI